MLKFRESATIYAVETHRRPQINKFHRPSPVLINRMQCHCANTNEFKCMCTRKVHTGTNIKIYTHEFAPFMPAAIIELELQFLITRRMGK